MREKDLVEDVKDVVNTEYLERFNEGLSEELKLLYDYHTRQADPAKNETRTPDELVPFRKFTSLDPELQWRLDNLKCSCGLCHEFSGTKDKSCWVFQ